MNSKNESKTEQAEINKRNGEQFMAENAKKKGVHSNPSGLQYMILHTSKSTGATSPKITNKIKVHFHGTLIDDSVFASTLEQGVPAEFTMSELIRGWQEALQLMHVGDKWRLFIPTDLAYGDSPLEEIIPINATLIFDVELLEII
jgi:FKBP-type peptidyl-prolyl cis-trans isomerase FklB